MIADVMITLPPYSITYKHFADLCNGQSIDMKVRNSVILADVKSIQHVGYDIMQVCLVLVYKNKLCWLQVLPQVF